LKSDIILHYCMDSGKHRSGSIQSNSANANLPTTPSPTSFSKPSSLSSSQPAQSNLHGGKGVDKLSAMTGKVTGFLKQQSQ